MDLIFYVHKFTYQEEYIPVETSILLRNINKGLACLCCRSLWKLENSGNKNDLIMSYSSNMILMSDFMCRLFPLRD